ncbi:MAG: glycosyltransferase [Bacteroidetes bacterium]|nr:glycosyltransferase [Bacteroidota bacterium]
MMIAAICFLLFLVYTGLLLFYWSAWKSIPDAEAPPDEYEFATKVTVLVPARNEANNILNCIHSILRQSYPESLLEILVIDDHSTDNTAALVQSFTNNNVKLLSLKETVHSQVINSYKKKAIETGIGLSKGNLIVTTDADCVVPVNWLKTIVYYYEKKKPVFIAAPVAIDNKNNFIEIFQSLDFLTLQGITGASVFRKIHSMCNGANLAYEKKVFHEVGGFSGIDAIASGDDMMLMHKIYKKYPAKVSFLKAREAIVQTKAQETLTSFFQQRIRWASKADKYDDKRIFFVLLVVYMFNVCLMIMPFIAAAGNYSVSMGAFQLSLFNFWLLLLCFKTIIELLFLIPVAIFFNRLYLLWWFPLMQPFHIVYTVVAGWLGKFGAYQWKGRNVK